MALTDCPALTKPPNGGKLPSRLAMGFSAYWLPKEYRFEGVEVVVRHLGNGVLLLPVNEPWAMLEAALESFEPGFQISREQPATQSREELAP